jgi:arsenate reductase (thioredoxin)
VVPRTIVFVCLHGSAKSVIAAEHFRRLAAQRGLDTQAMSAGLDPDPEVPPKVVRGLPEDGIDVCGHRPRRATQEELADTSQVVSNRCDLCDLAPPGDAVERWGDIPEVRADFTAARDRILARLSRLIAGWSGPGSPAAA